MKVGQEGPVYTHTVIQFLQCDTDLIHFHIAIVLMVKELGWLRKQKFFFYRTYYFSSQTQYIQFKII